MRAELFTVVYQLVLVINKAGIHTAPPPSLSAACTACPFPE